MKHLYRYRGLFVLWSCDISVFILSCWHWLGCRIIMNCAIDRKGVFVLDHHRLLFAKLFHAFWGHAFPNLMIEILDSIKYGQFSLQIVSAFFLGLSTLNHDLSFILKVSDAICLMQGWCFWTGLKRSNTNFSLFGILYFLLLQTWADKRRTMQFS